MARLGWASPDTASADPPRAESGSPAAPLRAKEDGILNLDLTPARAPHAASVTSL